MDRNPGDKAQTIRFPATALLAIDSTDRQDGDSLNNFIVQPGKILTPGYFTRIALTTFQMEWAIPNVNQQNNTLLVTDGVTTVELTITEGFYTISELGTALQTALNTWGLGGTFTVTVAPKTQYYVVTNDTIPFAFQLTDPFLQWGEKSLLPMMGLQLNTSLSLTQNGTYNNLMYTTYFDIRSTKLTAFQKVKDSSSDLKSTDLIIRIFIDFGQGTQRTDTTMWWTRPGSIAFDVTNPKWIRYVHTGQFLSDLDFQVLDDFANPLYFPEGHPGYNMIFEASED